MIVVQSDGHAGDVLDRFRRGRSNTDAAVRDYPEGRIVRGRRRRRRRRHRHRRRRHRSRVGSSTVNRHRAHVAVVLLLHVEHRAAPAGVPAAGRR